MYSLIAEDRMPVYSCKILSYAKLLDILCQYALCDMVAKSIGDDTNYKQLLILPFDN